MRFLDSVRAHPRARQRARAAAASGGKRGAALLAAGVGLALLVGGCAAPPPDPLIVAQPFTGERLIAALDVLDADGAVVGDERRRVTVHVQRADLVVAGPLEAIEGGLRQTFVLPPRFRDTPVRVRRMHRGKGGDAWQTLPALVARGTGDRLVVDFPLDGRPDPDAVEVHVVLAVVPRAETSQRFRDVLVDPGAVLIGAYGLDRESAAVTTGPVDLRIVAYGPEGERTLLQAELDPRDPRAETWHDYRIDLAAFAGQTIEVELQTRLRHRSGAGEAVACPLWSVPRVLVPRRPGTMLNVVLLSIDTLRADFLGAYGHERATSPNIDGLAAEGALFEQVVAPYPSTTASHMSMLTGTYPQVHGVYAPGGHVAKEILTLAEQLAKRGYQTAAVTEDGMLTAGAGFERGFAEYREFKSDPGVDGFVDDVMTSAVDWLAAHHDQRFFLFLHTYQVHDPYTPPPAWDRFTTYRVDGEERRVGDDTPPRVRARLGYEGDLLYTDAQVGRLLEALDDLGETARTLVVVTSDHGEALGEHGVVGHGWYVIEPVLHVPLLVRAPGRVRAGQRVPGPASLVDVTPTVLDLAGVLPAAQMQGTSLARRLDGPDAASPAERVVFAEKITSQQSDLTVVRRGDLKWIVGDRVERFDLARDPGELHGVVEPPDGEGARLAAEYRAANDEFRARLGARTGAAPVDEATQRKLRALGYVK